MLKCYFISSQVLNCIKMSLLQLFSFALSHSFGRELIHMDLNLRARAQALARFTNRTMKIIN